MNAYGETWNFLFDMRRKGHLVSRSDGNLLAGIVSTRANVDQVDSNLLQLLREYRRLLDTPTPHNQPPASTQYKTCDAPEPPVAMPCVILVMPIITPLLTLEPIRRADTVKDRLVPLGARRSGDLERKSESVVERSAVVVCAAVGKGRDKVWRGGLAEAGGMSAGDPYYGGDIPFGEAISINPRGYLAFEAFSDVRVHRESR
jgi:hypothetical protein